MLINNYTHNINISSLLSQRFTVPTNCPTTTIQFTNFGTNHLTYLKNICTKPVKPSNKSPKFISTANFIIIASGSGFILICITIIIIISCRNSRQKKPRNSIYKPKIPKNKSHDSIPLRKEPQKKQHNIELASTNPVERRITNQRSEGRLVTSGMF